VLEQVRRCLVRKAIRHADEASRQTVANNATDTTRIVMPMPAVA
jgi:hypothetical protein